MFMLGKNRNEVGSVKQSLNVEGSLDLVCSSINSREMEWYPK